MARKAKKVKKGKQGTRATNGSGTLVLHRGIYHARWYANGKKVSRSTGTSDLEKAKAFLEKMSISRTGLRDRDALAKLSQLVAQNLTDTDTRLKTIGLPVRDLFELFKTAPNRRPVTPRTLLSYKGELNVLDRWLESRHPEITSARDISQSVADEYIADREKSSSANTVNKDLNLFAAVWRTLSRRYGLEFNPWSPEHIARKRGESMSRRILTEKEIKALLDNSEGEIHLLILIGINTGLRMGDILNMTWDQVDLKNRLIAIMRTRKTGAPVCLPILDELYAELKAQQKRAKGPYVLPVQHGRIYADGNPAAVSWTMRWLFRRAGIKNRPGEPMATFHSLRHTFVTRLITRGVNPAIVREAVGHSTMLMTERYTHIDAETLQAALKP